ncbi:MAG: peptidyl-prolyl cis-trans isomerase [Dysgonomonas sp.]
MTKSFLLIALIITVFQACSSKGGDKEALPDEQALVSVNGKTLFKQEVIDIVPKGLNSTDSILAAEAYVKMWIKNELVYEKAKENIQDQQNIDELVENYRRSLIIYSYQEQLLKERLSKKISDREMLEYYNNNEDQFKLESSIIKGLFLKIPKTSTRLDDLRKWYKQPNEKAIENIEKYSLQNAVIYDYFYDKWVDLGDVMTNIPYIMDNDKQFLQNNKNLEVEDSTYVYLLNIKEYNLVGGTAPFEYSKNKILDILLNQKREDFMRKFEDDLYNSALKNKQIKIYNK